MLIGDDLMSLDLPCGSGSPLGNDLFLSQQDEFPWLDEISQNEANKKRDVYTTEQKLQQLSNEMVIPTLSPASDGGYEFNEDLDLSCIDTDKLLSEWEGGTSDVNVFDYLIDDVIGGDDGNVAKQSLATGEEFSRVDTGEEITRSSNDEDVDGIDSILHVECNDDDLGLDCFQEIVNDSTISSPLPHITINGEVEERLELPTIPEDGVNVSTIDGGTVIGVLDKYGVLHLASSPSNEMEDDERSQKYMLIDMKHLVEDEEGKCELSPASSDDTHVYMEGTDDDNTLSSLSSSDHTSFLHQLPITPENTRIRVSPEDERRKKREKIGLSSNSSNVSKRKKFPPVIKKERKKGQNRAAAYKYRMRKKDEKERAEQEMSELEGINNKLREEADSLEYEMNYLKGLMREIPDLAAKARALGIHI